MTFTWGATTYTFVWWQCLLAAFCGYCIGNLQFAILLSKIGFQDDVRNHGSGNAGSTNMLRVYGLLPGILTFVGDIAKAVCAVLAGRAIMGLLGGYVGAVFVVVGHCWPAVANFRGGKGVASSVGIMFATFPLGAAITMVVAVALIAIFRMVSLGSLIGSVLFFILVLILRHGDPVLCIVVAMLVLFIWVQHRGNIGRILRGEEKKLSVGKRK